MATRASHAPGVATRPTDVAIIGVGCQFPGGVTSLDALWRVFADGVDLVGQPPADRPATGFESALPGAYLDGIDRFDAELFGISLREAAEMDPQQRLLLEVAFGAAEDAGLPLNRLAGSRTGVYLGILGMDYTVLHARTLGPEGINPYYASGKEFSFGPGRIAHTFGLHGPSMMVNAACASSLLSVHLAVQALRAGECDAAFAGGVNLLVGPELSVFMQRIQAFSPRGVCRPFDAAADGVVRGEGCAVAVLKRHCDAVRDGDRILAVIRGSATNHDGHSAGLTAPNATAQELLLRTAQRDAGVGADEIDYVEAHSTGTPLGDPIELTALDAVFGPERPTERPLLIGSHKANFGHLDSAAGILGLLKSMLVVRRGTAPRQIKLDAPTPHFGWATSPLRVPTSAVDIAGDDRPRLAGVSAFGLSGTNVHVILEEAVPPPASAPTGERPVIDPVLVVSGPTEESLRAQSHAFERELAATPPEALDDLLHSAATRRTHHEYRLAVTGSTPEALATALADERDGKPHRATARGTTGDEPGRSVVHVFSGQGSQWPGMGLDLAEHPVFRETYAECDALLRRLAGWSLPDELALQAPTSRLGSTEIAQPAIFVLQLALSRWWASIGAAPDVVVGHSMGEITAACVAGAIDVPDALHLIVTRGRLLERSAGAGRMLAVRLPADDVRAALETHPEVSVAAHNGRQSVVVAGPDEAVAAAERDLRARQVVCIPLGGHYPFHTPAMRPHGEALSAQLGDLRVGRPAVRFVSTVDPESDEPALEAGYWSRNVWWPVRFAPAVDRILAGGASAFVEIGPHAVLAGDLRDAQRAWGHRPLAVASLMRDEPAASTLAGAVATLHAEGVELDWAAIHPSGRYRPLPATPLGGDRHWLPTPERERTAPTAAPTPAAAHSSPASPEIPTTRESLASATSAIVADILGHDQSWRPSRTRGLFDLGMNSLGLVELARRLGERFGCELESSVAIQHPTIDALTDHLLARIPLNDEPAVETAADRPDEREAGDDDAIAIVGLGCRFPTADGPDEYWRLMRDGRDAVTSPPPGRFPTPAGSDGTEWPAAYLDQIDGFDHAFFHISAREARSMDPQQRIFLEVAWEALEDAGIDTARLSGGRTGLFVGMNTTDYQQLITRNADNVDLYYGTGNSFSGAAGRLSYFLGVRGPSMACDTACSSSLVAVHLAAQSLRSGESEIALAGGVNVMATQTVFQAMAAGGALAPDGRCKTFDAAADGYGRGEGAGAVVLKTVSRAIADGDRIYAVINGSAVNHNGASGGLTAPSSVAQEELIRTALDQAGCSSADLDYVEVHGTGTRLGDEVELSALDRALSPRPPNRPLLVGSVKTNIGHLEAAAGVAGLVKTALALWHEEIPPHLHCPNPAGPLATAPDRMRVTTEPTAWSRRTGRPRRAGVSAFGITGTNAHVVLAEAPPASDAVEQTPERNPPPENDRGHLLVLSAATEQALAELRRRWRDWLAGVDEARLADVCYTAAARRTHLVHRLAVIGTCRSELISALGEAGDAHRWEGVVAEDADVAAEAGHGAGLDALARRYVAGGRIDWQRVFGGRHRVHPLPAYPWQRRRHWVEASDDPPDDHGVVASVVGPVFAPADGRGNRYVQVSLGPTDQSEPPGVAATADLLALTLAAARRLVPTAAGLRDLRVHVPVVDRAVAHDAQVVSTPDGAGTRLRLLARLGGTRPVELLTATVSAPAPAPAPASAWGADATEFGDPGLATDLGNPVDEAGMLDAAVALAAGGIGPAEPMVLTGIDHVTARSDAAAARLVGQKAGQAIDVRALDDDGRVVLELRGMRFGPTAVTDLPTSIRERVDGRRFTVRWKTVELTPEPQPAGRWLAVALTAAGAPTAEAICAELRAAGAEADVRWAADAAELADVVTGLGDLDGIVLACAPDKRIEVTDQCAAILRLAEASAAGTALWLLAPGAQDPDGTAAPDPHQAAVWAFGRVLATELAGRWGGPIDAATDPGAMSAVVRRMLGAAGDGEDELCLRGTEWYAPRLVQADPLPPAMTPLRCDPGRWYVLTDALRPAHRVLLDWLLTCGARKVLDLRGSWAGPADRAAAEAELRERGVQLRSIGTTDLLNGGGDVTAPEQWGGVVLAAPPAAIRTVDELGSAELRSASAWLDTVAAVDALAEGHELDFYVVTGSAAATWGSVGTAAQAMAEGYVDALVAARIGRQAPVSVLRWMPRSDSGERTARDRAVMEGSGLRPLAAADITEALDPAIHSGTIAALADMDEPTYVAACRGQVHRAFLDELSATEPARTGPTSLVTELAAMAPGPRADRLLDLVLAELTSVLGENDSADLQPDRGFFDLGMDSVLLLSFRARLHDLLGWELPATVTFEFSTARSLTTHLLSLIDGVDGGISSEEEPTAVEEPVDPDELSTADLMARLRTAVSSARTLLEEGRSV